MTRLTKIRKKGFFLCLVFFTIGVQLLCVASLQAEEQLNDFDKQILNWAKQCAADVTAQFEKALASGTLTVGEIFDTFYIPIPGTTPQKYHTRYDQSSDEAIRPIIDAYLKKNSRILFVVPVDRNGYLPTHNTKFTQPLTGDTEHDTKWNRTKRIFNDTTGLAAASNTKPYLLQKYSRDTGEVIWDLSVPIYINGQHWGAIRIGYK